MTNNFIDNLMSLLGKPNSDIDLISFFISCGFVENENALRIKDYDEYNLYIDVYNKGLSFIFTDEAFFLNQSEKPILGKITYLSTIFLYNEGVDDFSGYKNGLPFNIDFSMKKNELRKIFGEPFFTKIDDAGVVRSQKWNIVDKPYTFYVAYTYTGDIRYISLTIPC